MIGMAYMFFGATNFNQNIGSWNTSTVEDMLGMFNGATTFNQDLSNWNGSSLSFCSDFATSATAWLSAYGGFISISGINATHAASVKPYNLKSYKSFLKRKPNSHRKLIAHLDCRYVCLIELQGGEALTEF